MSQYTFCHAQNLASIIQNTPDGEICRIETDEYYLSERITISGKKNITIDFNDSVFITKYVNSKPADASTNALLLQDCENITLKNLTLITDTPVNMSATVEDFDQEELSFIIKVDDSYTVIGDEILLLINSFDADGSPDHKFDCYAKNPDPNVIRVVQNEIVCFSSHVGLPNIYLGQNRFKVFLADLTYLQNPMPTPGMRLCIRHTAYGPSVITLKNCQDTTLQNITMSGVPGFGVTVLTRCHNLTIDGLRMLIPDKIPSFMSCNCDGIHIVGLTGKLILKNSLFDGLGDDALNVHSAAGTVTAITAKDHKLTCHYCKKKSDGALPDKWCLPGEVLRFFDPITQTVSATATVEDFKNGILTYSNLSGEIKIGYMIQNTAYTPSCEISDCEIRNSRARGFLIQTEHVEIKNCTFYGTSNSGIKAAPAFIKWYEVGPCHHLHIHHNTFTKCGFVSPDFPAVAAYTRHFGNDETITGLHSNIRIDNNIFKQSSGTCIGISSTNHVDIFGNHFENRTNTTYPAIQIVSCTDVNMYENKDY